MVTMHYLLYGNGRSSTRTIDGIALANILF